MCRLSWQGMQKSLWLVKLKEMLFSRAVVLVWEYGVFRQARQTQSKRSGCAGMWSRKWMCWLRHHHTYVRTRPMRTGSGPLYSSITKNWFQSQLLRWRERGPPSSDAVTHFVCCRILWSGTPLTPVSKWRSGRLVYSSELGTRLRALITPSTSSLVKVLLFWRFRVSSRLRLANRGLAAESSLKPKLFGFLSVLGRVSASSFTFWCGISESFAFDNPEPKTCGGLPAAISKSRSSFKRPAATEEAWRSMKRNSRSKCAAMAEMVGCRSAGQVRVRVEDRPDLLNCVPPPLEQVFISAPSATLAHADPTTWEKTKRRTF